MWCWNSLGESYLTFFFSFPRICYVTALCHTSQQWDNWRIVIWFLIVKCWYQCISEYVLWRLLLRCVPARKLVCFLFSRLCFLCTSECILSWKSEKLLCCSRDTDPVFPALVIDKAISKLWGKAFMTCLGSSVFVPVRDFTGFTETSFREIGRKQQWRAGTWSPIAVVCSCLVSNVMVTGKCWTLPLETAQPVN